VNWKQYGWRCAIGDFRYEIEAHGALFEAWFVDQCLTSIHSGDGFNTMEEAFAACERHNSARLAKTGE